MAPKRKRAGAARHRKSAPGSPTEAERRRNDARKTRDAERALARATRKQRLKVMGTAEDVLAFRIEDPWVAWIAVWRAIGAEYRARCEAGIAQPHAGGNDSPHCEASLIRSFADNNRVFFIDDRGVRPAVSPVGSGETWFERSRRLDELLIGAIEILDELPPAMVDGVAVRSALASIEAAHAATANLPQRPLTDPAGDPDARSAHDAIWPMPEVAWRLARARSERPYLNPGLGSARIDSSRLKPSNRLRWRDVRTDPSIDPEADIFVRHEYTYRNWDDARDDAHREAVPELTDEELAKMPGAAREVAAIRQRRLRRNE